MSNCPRCGNHGEETLGTFDLSYGCSKCLTHWTAWQQREISRLTAEVKAKDEEIDKYGCTPEQYHGALTMLWNALGNPKMDDRIVFQRVVDEIASLKAQLEARNGLLER
jgi:hypothetical protein